MSAKSGKKSSSKRKNIILGVMTFIVVLSTIAAFAEGFMGNSSSTSNGATPTSTPAPTQTVVPTVQ